MTISSDGNYPAVTNTGSCTDNAGNVATPVTVGPISIDLTKPTISAAALANTNGWYNSNVTVRFTCTAITADTPDPSVVGQPVVVQYAVTPQGAGTVSCTATVATGQCSLTFTYSGAHGDTDR